MRHLPALVLPALAVMALLAGCTSAPPVDEQALAKWKTQQEARTETEDAVLGVLSADTTPGDEDPAHLEPGVRVQFPDSRTIDHLEFSCYGNGHMRGIVRTVLPGGSQSIELDPMDCRDSPHQIEVSSSKDVDSVAFNDFDSDRPSAWRLVIFGPGPSGE
ncbi:hypothetical protein EDF52_110174 [Curtobacterium sp. PhB42]|uniref:hypothetical protein n=1 Tax=unclassified Curtobacterium TaxID=257496 RepID=UPI001062616E|nr:MULTISPECIES: hypothetical protein [unclassified Curtobacterium]TDW44530.1 hypothetical protein EDF52_110174 [Curtobacterium sp. PhB42]TDW49570.1 hypothetical protein EDF47_11823 [Curtobacterium sp. PhB190]